HADYQGRLVGPTQHAVSVGDDEKAGDVELVVSDSGLEYFPAVDPGGLGSRDASRSANIFFDDMLHAARRVVKGNRLNFRMLAKKITALLQSHRMRQNTMQVPELNT